jgi:hypothetical protein
MIQRSEIWDTASSSTSQRNDAVLRMRLRESLCMSVNKQNDVISCNTNVNNIDFVFLERYFEYSFAH